MSGPLIAVPRHARLGQGFSRAAQARALEHPGRRPDGIQTAASWITELVDRRTILILCSFCRAKFNPKTHRYRRYYSPDLLGKTDGYQVNGRCDGCRQHTALIPGGGTSFIAEETYALVCLDPSDARRRARAAAGATSAWARIRHYWSGSRRPVEALAHTGD